MMSSFRRFAASPIGVGIFAILAIILLATLYEGRNGFNGSASLTGGDTIATVGGKTIGSEEMRTRVQNGLEAARQQNPQVDMAAFLTAGGFENSLDDTANGRALQLFANNQGMVASKRAIDGEIASIPLFNGPNGKFDADTFRRILAQRKITEVQVRDDFEREILTKALMLPIAGAARVPTGLATPYAQLLLEGRKGQIAVLPAQLFAPKTPPTDAELAIFYRQNIARYTLPEQRVIRYTAFDKARFAGKVMPTDAEIQKVYETSSALYGGRATRSFTQVIVPTLDQANALVAKIKGGQSIADAAKSIQREAIAVPMSDEAAFAKLTAANVARAGFAAPKGDIAAVERSGLGFHVVRVDNVAAIAATPLSAVRGKIAAELAATREARALADFAGDIDAAFSNGATLDEVATKYGLTVLTTPALTAQGQSFGPAGYQAPPEVVATLRDAFQSSTDDEPTVTPLANGAGTVVWKLEKIIAAAPKPLAEIRDAVIAGLQVQKGARAAKAAADAIAAAANAGMPLSQAMGKAGIPLPAPQPAGGRRIDMARSQTPVPPPVEMLFAIAQKHARTLEMPQGQGWYIVYLDTIEQGDLAKAPGIVDATRQQFARVFGDEYVRQFSNAVKAEIGVTKNAAAIAALKRTLAGSVAK